MFQRASPNARYPTSIESSGVCGPAQNPCSRDHRRNRSTSHQINEPEDSMWVPSMRHTPSRVLDAPGLVDDYYSTCLSWGRNVIGAILGSEALLFDAADPNRFASYKSPISCASTTHSSNAASSDVALAHRKASAARLTSITVSAKTDSEALLGSSLGMVELVAVAEGRSEAVSVAAVSVDDTDDCLIDPTSPLQTILAASVVSHAQPLFDMVLRSVASSDATDAHPFLFLVGMASGSVAVLDVRCSQPVVARTKRVALPPPPPRQVAVGPSNLIPGLGDRVLSVSWNSSGSLFAAGTNASGVSIWSLANMNESLMHVDLAGEFRDASAAASRCNHHTVVGGLDQGSAVRALRFHPSRPFELAYGGGVGDGTLRIVNVSTRRTEYAVATGAQVAAVVYSPCGRHLVSTHGLRKADLPTMLNSGPLTQTHRRGADSFGGTGHGTWGGAPDGPCSRQRNCVAVWCRGRPTVTPVDVLLEARRRSPSVLRRSANGSVDCARRGSSSVSPSSRRILPCSSGASLPSRSSSRESLDFDGALPLEEEGTWVVDETVAMVGAVTSGAGLGQTLDAPYHATPAPFPLQLRQRLDGHTSRPLYLAAPRSGPHLGSIVTGAGGPADGTLRNWTVFCLGDRTASFPTAGDRGSSSRTMSPLQEGKVAEDLERNTRGSISPPTRASPSAYSAASFGDTVLR